MKKRTKKLLALLVVLSLLPVLCLPLLVLLASLTAPKLSYEKMQPWEWNERYSYDYIDYNNDGQMELVTFGGDPAGYEEWPKAKIYTYVDGEVKLFEPAENSITIKHAPWPYKHKRTQQRRFFSWAPSRFFLKLLTINPINEVVFDFETFQYNVKTRNEYILFPFSFPFVPRGYRRTWKMENYEFGSKEGDILTPERIEELLLNPPN